MEMNSRKWFNQILEIAQVIHNHGSKSLVKIDEEKRKIEECINQAKDSIDTHIKNAVAAVQFWEVVFTLELMETAEKQLNLLPKREELDEKVQLLGRTIYSAKVASDTKSHEDIHQYLKTIEPLIDELKKVSVPSLKEVSFVPNSYYPDNLKTSKDRFKLGYISHLKVEPTNLHLLASSKFVTGKVATFVIHTTTFTDTEEIFKLIQCELKIKDEDISSLLRLKSSKFGFELTFLLREEIANYTLCVYLFNQHIHGSPFTFISSLRTAKIETIICSPIGHSSDNEDVAVSKPYDDCNATANASFVTTSETPCKSKVRRNMRFGTSWIQRLPKDSSEACIVDVSSNAIPVEKKNVSRQDQDISTDAVISYLEEFSLLDDQFKKSPKYSTPPTSFFAHSAEPMNPYMANGTEDIKVDPGIDEAYPVCNLEKPSIEEIQPTKKKKNDEDYEINNNSKADKIIEERSTSEQESKDRIVEKKVTLSADCRIILKPKDGLRTPIGVANLLSNEIVVADTSNDRLVLFSAAGSYIKSFNSVPPMKRPSAISLFKDGRFAVIGTKFISLFSSKCCFTGSLAVGQLNRPFGLAVNGDQDVVTVELSPKITITTIGVELGKVKNRVVLKTDVPSSLLGQSKPYFVACPDDKYVLIVDLGLNTIYKVNKNTGDIVKKVGKGGKGLGEFNDPSGIVCDASGYMLVGDSKNHRIQVFTPSGEFISVLKVDRPLRRPSGLCLTDDGHIIVANYWENTVVKYKLHFQ